MGESAAATLHIRNGYLKGYLLDQGFLFSSLPFSFIMIINKSENPEFIKKQMLSKMITFFYCDGFYFFFL